MIEKKISIEAYELRYLLAQKKAEKAEADLAAVKDRLASAKAEIKELLVYLEGLKSELREKTGLLDEINDRINRI